MTRQCFMPAEWHLLAAPSSSASVQCTGNGAEADLWNGAAGKTYEEDLSPPSDALERLTKSRSSNWVEDNIDTLRSSLLHQV